ncbi:MAG: hypothetical protein M0P73_08490 [Syntrophobacterales bacterium]|jgi:hypothetical protein|nr:hypothetical protein [Syntrophobacterales bacterium]
MGYRDIPCPKCGGTQEIRCSWCQGEGGFRETYAGETTWKPCPYCLNGKTRCDNGCVHGYIRVFD